MTLYEILEVSKDADIAEIKTKYKLLAMRYHPDRQGGSDEKFKELQQAYQILSDEVKRARYDATGRTDEILTPKVAAEREFAVMLNSIIEQTHEINILEPIIAKLEQELFQVKCAISHCYNVSSRLRKLKRKIKVPTTNSPLTNIINQQRTNNWIRYRKQQFGYNVLKEMLVLANTYSYNEV